MAEPLAQLSHSLAPSQTRSFLEDALPAAKAGLNLQQIVCTTTEPLDFSKFREAWQTVANRHVALGVAFRRDDRQQPYQRLWPPVDLALSFEERPERGAPEQAAFVERWLDQDRRHLFDLAHPPLTRISAFRFADRSVTWIWTFHQILLDGPSARLVLEDFFACYGALAAGRPVLLPERRPFSELVSWHETQTARAGAHDRAFWERLVTQGEIDSKLFLKRPQAASDPAQEKLAVDLGEAARTALVAWASASGLSLKTVVLGAWGLLLGRYYRSSSVTFGTIRFCRRGLLEGTEEMIGPLLNYLPVHAEVPAHLPLLAFLRGIQEQQAAMSELRWTSPEVIRSSLPTAASEQLFDSCVLHQRVDPERELNERLGGRGLRSFSIREKPNLPLLLMSSEEPQLAFELIYQAGLFERTDLARLMRSFVVLLEQFPVRPSVALGELELLSPDERAQGIGTLTGPDLPLAPDKGLHTWFEEQARRTPDEPAIIAETMLTYAELDRRAANLARQLLELNLGPDRLVAVFLPRSAALLVAILGTLKSGAAYLPVDVGLPPARLKNLLEEANAGAVLTDPALTALLPPSGAPVIFVAADHAETGNGEHGSLPRVSSSQLAYAIATSGTTGRPKLIGVEHRQVSNLLAFATRELLQAADVRCVPFIDSPSFDSSVSQIFTTLALGGTLICLPDLAALPSSPFFGKFTCLGTTPSLLAAILKSGELPPSVRLIGLGAEAVPPDLLQQLADLPQLRKVINYYGPTETTVYCTYSILLDRADANQAVDLRHRGRVIGRPIANTRAYVVDDFGHLAPPGAPGELHVSGAAVARGYLNAAGDAALNFRPDPFQSAPAARLYQTGDIVCLRPDGQLEFHGRKDHQLKCNGVRIEAEEIENALQDFPGVRHAVVDLRADDGGPPRLVAYLAADAKSVSRQELKKALRLCLPDAMVPHHFVFLPDLPLTSNGKVDRAALSRLPHDSSFTVPTAPLLTQQEKEMTALWERHLSRRPIGLHDDYFELGGDSLSAINLLAAIDRQFRVKLKPAVLFDHSTIADLLAVLKNPAPDTEAADFIPTCALLPFREGGDGFPLVVLPGGSGTALVHYRHFADKLAADHPVYLLQHPYALLLEKSDEPLARLAGQVAAQVLETVGNRPFVLFGHCMGGLLAWHVAGVLRKRNAPAFRLVLYAPPAVQDGMNLTEDLREAATHSRLSLFFKAYRPAWEEWRMDHGTAWWTYLTFGRWMLTNFLERRGWIRTREDRFRFVKLSYLRLLQNSPLEPYADEALLIYHLEEAGIVSRSLWPSLCDRLRIEYIPGHHRVWQTSILSLLPMIRERLQNLETADSIIA